jgi:hypothetical protein
MGIDWENWIRNDEDGRVNGTDATPGSYHVAQVPYCLSRFPGHYSEFEETNSKIEIYAKHLCVRFAGERALNRSTQGGSLIERSLIGMQLHFVNELILRLVVHK